MSKTRRKHSAEFKVKVVFELLQGTETLSEISSKYGVHPGQLAKWRKAFLEKAPEIFSDKVGSRERVRDEVESELYKKIGQLQVELDYLKKKSGLCL
jgi:transposase-like protein